MVQHEAVARPAATDGIAELIRNYRLRSGLTQSGLARRSGLNIRTVRDIERGRVRSPRPGSLDRLGRALGLGGQERERLSIAVRAAGAEPFDNGLSVGILGPLEIRVEGRPVSIGSPVQRTILGVLALRANDRVSRDEIIDLVWDVRPPRTCQAQVQAAIGRLRSLIEPGRPPATPATPARTLCSAAGGYRLELDPARTDAGRFEDLAARAAQADKTGDTMMALALFDQAMRCWRGRVLADLDHRLCGYPAAAALARRRVDCGLAYAAAAAAGLDERVIDMLRGLAVAEPLHEALHARLVSALSRSGHRAAALDVYSAILRRLSDDVGVRPGEELSQAYKEAIDVHGAQSAQSGPPPARPVQLPAELAEFVGRGDPPAEPNLKFGGLLRRFREVAGLTQRELAARAGLSTAAVCDLEQGRTGRPQTRSVRALATSLGLRAADARTFQAAARAGDRQRTPYANEPVGVSLAVSVLGPLSVWVDDRQVALTAHQRRVVLTMLALSPNTVVTRADLVDALWGEAVPVSSANVLQGHVARLRRALPTRSGRRGGAGPLESVPGGYRLNVDEEQLDLLTFRRLVRDAEKAAGNRLDEAATLLERALGLWRGDPAADVAGMDAHPLVVALVDEYVRTVARHAELVDALGTPARALPWLRAAAVRHPLHELVHGQLMLALAAGGSQAAALEVFDRIKHRLATDLGVSPGPELVAVHRRVLLHQWTMDPVRSVPAQLPPDVAKFVGRAAHMAQLNGLLDAVTGQGLAGVGVVTGTAGVGKTALAVHWARRVAARFPDGHLFVNLHGFGADHAVAAPEGVLSGFLEALGVPSGRQPTNLAALTGLYRSRLAGRRMLIMLDNARDEEQVRPLLPAAAGCLALITSREHLYGLAATDSAHMISLDVLAAAEAASLLAGRIGAARLAAEPQAVEQLITGCAGLPLALSVIAARAASRPTFPLRELADELHAGAASLAPFTSRDPATDLAAVFSWSYRGLSPQAARLFRLLGLHPGPDIGIAATASLAGRAVADTLPLLRELTGANMIREVTPARYTFHDLLRAFALQQAESDDTDADRHAALVRTLDHYLHTSHAAVVRFSSNREPVALPPLQPGVVPEAIHDHAHSVRWYHTEHQVLLAAAHRAAQTRLDAHAWLLAWALTDFLDRRGRWSDLAAVQHNALLAAQRLADPHGQAHAHRGLARAHANQGRFDDAHTHLQQAARLNRAVGDQPALGSTYTNIAIVYLCQGRPQQALPAILRGLRHYRAAGHRWGEAAALANAAYAYALQDRHDRALQYASEALAINQQLGCRTSEAAVCDTIGYTHHRRGDHAGAATWYNRALTINRAEGQRRAEATVLIHLADNGAATGDVMAACQALQQALEILEPVGHPDAEVARTKLRRLQPLPG